MVRALFTTFLRNLKKNKFFSIINIFGFTLGIVSVILILLFVFSELSYDRYNDKADRIYRLCIKALIGDTRINQTYSSARNFREMKARFPEIENGVKFVDLSNGMIRSGERTFSEPVLIFSDSTVFEVFTMPFVLGNPKTALNRPNTVVLSETGARKYFGDANPLGKDMEMDLPFGKIHFAVTGVIKDIPKNSHFHFDVLGSLVSFPEMINSDGWSNNNFKSYFLLKPGTSAKSLEAKFTDYVIESFGAKNYEAAIAAGNSWDFFLQPLRSIHLKSDLNGEFEPNGNIRYVYIFSIIAFFVLVIASINFMNLSTAKSVRRAREVGIRKVVGSTKGQLIRQFLGESLIMAMTSLVLAVVTVELLLPAFSDWLGRKLTLDILSEPWLILALVGMTLVIGILAGLYPAFVLSSFRPARVLKSQSVNEKRGMSLRNILVIIQFGASIFLITGTLAINKQLRFIRNSDIGFNKDNLLILRTPPSFSPVTASFKEEMLKQSGIESVSASSSLPGFGFTNLGFRAEKVERGFALNIISCDPEYFKTMGLTVSNGRFLSTDYLSDSSGIVLNETAVKVLGMKDPLGSKMSTQGNPPVNFKVVGVVKDFNYESVHSEVRPIGLVFQNGALQMTPEYLTIRFKPGNDQKVKQAAEHTWEKLFPGMPFRYSFMEDDYNQMYRNEIQTSQVFSLLALLTMIVAILGLLGLVSYMAQQRTREIAVRKVFGAQVNQIMSLLTWKFTRLILVSFVIACPVAWWVMTGWLRNFVYRVPLSAWIFLVSGTVALLVAIITVNAITYRAATAGPAESLKYE
jgi:putative ABC transport system permease protein